MGSDKPKPQKNKTKASKQPPPLEKTRDENGMLVDSLLESLVFLSAHHGASKSAESIRAGLPYDEKGMGPMLFCEAAEKLGIKAKVVKREKIEDIDKAVLPCVLVLKEESAVVLMSYSQDSEMAQIFLPDTKNIMDVPLDKLSGEYLGHAIFCKPKSEFYDPSLRDNEEHTEHHWFWSLILGNSRIYGMVLLASLFINLFALVSPIFVMNVYDRVLPNNAVETGWALGIGALVAFTFDFIFRTLRGYLIDFAGRKTDVTAARRIYDQLLNIKLSARPQSSGAFANMLRDFDAVREFITSATITAVVDLPFTLLFLFVIYQLGGSVAFVLVGLMAVVCIAGYLIQFKLKNLVRRSTKAAETKHGLLVETIQGLETIKSVGADGRFRARYGHYAGDSATYAKDSRFLSSLGTNIAVFLQQSSAVIVILFGMYMVQSGDLTVGGLIATVILAGRAIAPIGQIANLMTRYHQAGGALKTLNEIMAQDVERPPQSQFLHRPNLRGHILLDKVSFAYPNTQTAVVENVSFEIREGERVGIIGRVGSGKSTLARLLMKLYEPQDGAILIDETDSRQIDPADLRRSIAYISQDVVLFNGSIRDNITATMPHATEEQVLKVAQMTGVHDFVSRHPMGYDAPVGELGQSLSGGQRQAIALARAMITNPNIILCDEPTNSMDTQAEKAFIDYITDNMKGRTFIMVTHKQSMLQLVDRLILMHNGKLIMDAPRDEVIAALNTGTIRTNSS